jgi:excinuclease UvrABC nuclease subunit
LQIDIDQNYDEVLMLSEEIGKKKAAHDKNMQVPIALIKKASKSIVQRMEQRMLHYSNKEDYELAAAYRKNKLYIENKMKWLDDLETKGVDRLNSEEYESAFTMKDMDF